MVIVNVPTGVLLRVVMVSALVPDPVTEAGLKVAVVRDGNPVALRLTLPEKPFSEPTVTVYVVLEPRVTVREDGVAETVKSGFRPVTTRVTVAECVRVPLVPVIVRV